jgi:hypothetical protein
MARRQAQNGLFVPKHPEKYKGKTPISYRSSWELVVFNQFDAHPNILEWASESISIPYQNPLTGRYSMYIPDLLVVYSDKYGKKHAELIEIKPAKEAIQEKIKSKRDAAAFLINQAKWQAAYKYCQKHGLVFRILTEMQLFRGYGK